MKVIPPIDPLSVRTLSPRSASEQERTQIAHLVSLGLGPTTIGHLLGGAYRQSLTNRYRSDNTIARRPVVDSLRTGRHHRRGHSR